MCATREHGSADQEHPLEGAIVARVPTHSNVAKGGVGRVAVGIDPSRAALQIALLSPRGDERRERRVPLGPAAVDVLGEVLAGQQAVIAIEGSHSTGQLFLLELLARKYDVREIQPFVSKRFRRALTTTPIKRMRVVWLSWR